MPDGNVTVACRENLLAAERVSFQRQIDASEQKYTDAQAEVAEGRSEAERMRNAASATEHKIAQLEQQLRDLQVSCSATPRQYKLGLDVFYCCMILHQVVQELV